MITLPLSVLDEVPVEACRHPRCPVLTEPSDVRRVLRASIEVMRERLGPALRTCGIGPGSELRLLYPLRSGYLLHELPERSLAETLRAQGYGMSEGVIGIAGTDVYGPPDDSDALPVVIDTSAGRAHTLLAIAEWFRAREQRCLVSALTITRQTIQELAQAGAEYLPIHAVAADARVYDAPGPRLRIYRDEDGRCVRAGDLGDTFYGREKPADLAARFCLLTPRQRGAFLHHYERNAG